MITTVLFDLDGLLIDSEITYFQMAKEFVEMHGKTFTLEQYVKERDAYFWTICRAISTCAAYQ